MTDFPRHEELTALLNAFCNTALTVEEAARLERLLSESNDARQMYLQYMDLHAALQWEVGSRAEAGSKSHSSAARNSPGRDMILLRRPRAEKQKARPCSGFMAPIKPHAARLVATGAAWFAMACLAVGAAALIVLVCIALSGGPKPADLANTPQNLPSPRSGRGAEGEGISKSGLPAPRSAATSPVVARLAAADCQWVDPESALGEGALLAAGQKLELASGQVEIVFQSGAEVNLHGPAIFENRVGQQRFSDDRTAQRPRGHAGVARLYGPLADGGDGGPGDGIQRRRLGRRTQPDLRRRGRGRSAVGQRAAHAALGVGQSIEVEPGTPSVIARIEPGDGTPAFKFPTIEPPSSHDYADASQGHAHIRVLRGRPQLASGPVEVLLDGKGQSKPDSPGESFFFAINTSGMILLDLGRKIPVKKVNTYSWHHRHDLPRDHVRATQKYYLYGSLARRRPAADGNLAAAGWTLIAQVNTDEFFGFPRRAARPAQQAVSITATDGGPIGEYRYLLWDVRPTRSDALHVLATTRFTASLMFMGWNSKNLLKGSNCHVQIES